MRRILCLSVVIALLFFPSVVLASGFIVNIHVIRQEDGSTSGELWYNDKEIWRLTILPDGAKSVLGSYNNTTTFIIPDVIDGFFLIKIQ